MEAEWEWPALSPRVRRYWLLRKEARNQRAFRRVVREFRPDVVHMWNPAAASLSPARIAQDLGVPVVYLVSDGWLARLASGGDEWERLVRLPPPTLYSRLFRGLTRRAGLHGSLPEPPLDPVQFVSDYLRREVEAAGCALRSAEVVPWGVDVERFSFRREPIAAPRRLLYVGQLMPHKGVHTCIEALHVLRRDPHWGSVTLDIVGSGIDPSYVERLHELARTYGLTESVRFTGAMPPSELPAVYRAADVVVFSSIWPEPFSIALLEAMASGVPVVATCTGGSAEILRDGVNALVYRAGDAGDCARQLARALADPAMLEEMR